MRNLAAIFALLLSSPSIAQTATSPHPKADVQMPTDSAGSKHLSHDVIDAFIQKRMPDVNACIEKASSNWCDNQACPLRFDFNIEPDGHPTDVSVTCKSACPARKDLQACLVSKITSWNFPRSSDPKAARVKYVVPARGSLMQETIDSNLTGKL